MAQFQPILSSFPSTLKLITLTRRLQRPDSIPWRRRSFPGWGRLIISRRTQYARRLDRVAGVFVPGSRIVLDYKLDRELVPEESLPFADKLDRFVARRGEPMLSTFTPEELKDMMSGFGFVELENLPAGEQKRRYLSGKSGLVDPAPNFSFALYGVP